MECYEFNISSGVRDEHVTRIHIEKERNVSRIFSHEARQPAGDSYYITEIWGAQASSACWLPLYRSKSGFVF